MLNAFYVCLVCMPYMYALYVCLLRQDAQVNMTPQVLEAAAVAPRAAVEAKAQAQAQAEAKVEVEVEAAGGTGRGGTKDKAVRRCSRGANSRDGGGGDLSLSLEAPPPDGARSPVGGVCVCVCV